MKNSIYSTAAGMLTTSEMLNVAANNLANVNTNGYKADIAFEQTLKFLAEGPYPGKDQPILGGTTVNTSYGIIKQTGRNLDVAFEGPGFLAVQGLNNQEMYTRNGSLNLNTQKELVTGDGYYVLDKFNRKITIFGEKLELTPAGDVFVDGNYFTSMKIVDIPNRDNLEKVGSNFFTVKDKTKAPTLMENPQIQVGALERSNVDLLAGLGTVTHVERTFELQKTAADIILRLLRRSISDIPRPV